MQPSAREYLQHILAEAGYVISAAKDLNKDAFINDETLKRAFVFGVDYDIVWDVVTNKVPPLAQEIQKILDSEFPSNS